MRLFLCFGVYKALAAVAQSPSPAGSSQTLLQSRRGASISASPQLGPFWARPLDRLWEVFSYARAPPHGLDPSDIWQAQFLGWRAIFWFLTIMAVVFLVPFVMFFPETGTLYTVPPFPG